MEKFYRTHTACTFTVFRFPRAGYDIPPEPPSRRPWPILARLSMTITRSYSWLLAGRFQLYHRFLHAMFYKLRLLDYFRPNLQL